MGRTKKMYEDICNRERESTYNHITNTQIRFYPDIIEYLFTNRKIDTNGNNRAK